MIPPEMFVTQVPADVGLVLLARAGLDGYRRAHRGDNPRVDAVLVEMTTAAIRWRELMTNSGQDRAPSTDTAGSSSPLLTTTQAAQRAGVSDRTIRRAITAGHLPATRVGRAYLVSRADIDAYTRRTG